MEKPLSCDRNRFEKQFYHLAKKFTPVTDKVTTHQYEIMYGIFLFPLRFAAHRPKILEIGLGCDMNYGPGASAKVWQSLLPQAELWEAEYDKSCVAKARQAVSLGVQDGESWFVLGNAYVAMFFTVEANPALMDKALAAYGRAEANGERSNPDLFYGRAQVHRYKEHYQRAADDYRRAAAKLDASAFGRRNQCLTNEGRRMPKQASLYAHVDGDRAKFSAEAEAVQQLAQGRWVRRGTPME